MNLNGFCQTITEYLDPQFNVVKDSANCKYVRTVNRLADDNFKVQVNYKSGSLMMTGGYADKDLTLENGAFTYYYANGRIESEGSYRKGSKIGNWKRWNYDGRPKPDRFYPDDTKARSPRATAPAKFPGGTTALQDFVTDSLRYPKEALERKIEGTVYVTFIVDSNGDVRQAEVSEGVHYLLDEEALRFVSSMPAWTPATRNGVTVDSSYIFPINFSIENPVNRNVKTASSRP